MHICKKEKKNNLRRMQMSRILFTICQTSHHLCLSYRVLQSRYGIKIVGLKSVLTCFDWWLVPLRSSLAEQSLCFISFPVLKRLIYSSRREALLPICISIWPSVHSWHFLQPANVSRGVSRFCLQVCYLLLLCQLHITFWTSKDTSALP